MFGLRLAFAAAACTHFAFRLDRSGSMQSTKTDTQGGFDAYIQSQKGQPGRCTVTLAQVDDQYEEVYSGLDFAAVPPLDLQPRSTTALNDSNTSAGKPKTGGRRGR